MMTGARRRGMAALVALAVASLSVIVGPDLPITRGQFAHSVHHENV